MTFFICVRRSIVSYNPLYNNYSRLVNEAGIFVTVFRPETAIAYFSFSSFACTITKKLYEDNALSKIADDEYARLSAQFTDERSQANERLTAIAEELKKEERNITVKIITTSKLVVCTAPGRGNYWPNP